MKAAGIEYSIEPLIYLMIQFMPFVKIINQFRL